MTPEEVIIFKEALLQLMQDPEVLQALKNAPGISVHIMYILMILIGGVGVSLGRIWRFHREIVQYRKDVCDKLTEIVNLIRESIRLREAKQ